MLFSSSLFVFYVLPIVLGVYFAIRPGLRNAWLLLASLLFYAWGEKLLLGLMLVTIVTNWGFGFWIERAKRTGEARGPLVFAVVFDLGMLVLFKYADWLWSVLGQALYGLGWIDEPLPLLGTFFEEGSAVKTVFFEGDHVRLPIGISFYTFQTLSYVVDVWRGVVPVQRNLLHVALYTALFPQLIAGPIVRYRDVAAEIVHRVVTREGFADGIRRFVVGLAKKMLVANVCARTCDQIFAVPTDELPMALAWLGIVCYTLQIYFDFSGYSDMAIGLGRMFGFHFLENFDFPYISRSITEFWRRWHISLSTWFRDYLYIPLGGNRSGPVRTYVNLLTVFVLCGLWHGASFSFLVWGLFHGAFLVIERAFLGRVLERTPAIFRHVYLMLAVMVGWVFFRASTPEHALGYLGALFGFTAGDTHLHPWGLYANALVLTAIAAGVVGSVPWVSKLLALRARWEAEGRFAPAATLEVLGLASVSLLFFLSALELAGRSYNPFIYFRF